MKPKEFIEKYGIQGGWNPKHQINITGIIMVLNNKKWTD